MTRTIRLMTALLVAVAAPLAAAPSAHAADAVPYEDTKAVGYVGLCDKDGKPVTSGSVTQKPFVWRAVSSVKAPAGYDAKGGTATLYAYQPRKGVDASYWSGDVLTSAATYSNPQHPMAAAVDQDEPLATLLDTYPAGWDGYYQLRIYLSAPGQTAYTQSYAATDIKVTGLNWKVVRGGAADCASGTAVSNATALLGLDKSPTANATGKADAGNKAPDRSTATSTAAPSAGATPGVNATDPALAAADTTSSSDDGGANVGLIVALLIVVAALGGGGYWFWRQRQDGAA